MTTLHKKLNKELVRTEADLKEAQELETNLNLLREYEGEDEVISSQEAKESVEEELKKEQFKITTGIPKLDYILDGFREGNLVVVSAPTKQGKTTLCQNFTSYFSKNGVNSLWFSYEVPVAEFMEKFSGELPIFYLPRKLKGHTLFWLEQRIVEAIAKYDVKVAFIDHLHYLLDMEGSGRGRNISLEIGAIMRELKKLALKYKIAIVVICHMKKTDIEERPELDDIRDSSFIAQEADIVLLIWRVKDRQSKDQEIGVTYKDEAVVKVAANRRTGKTGFVKLSFQDNQFHEITEFYENDNE